MHNKFKLLHEENDIILLDNNKFDVGKIINKIIKDFEPKENDLNLKCKNSFIKKYFKQINVQGIFNQIEWIFLIKNGIKCEISTSGNNRKQKGKLQIRVILEFYTSNSSNFDLKVSLLFCPEEPEFKETPKTQPELRLNSIYPHEQNPSDSHSARSEKIRIPTR